MTEPSARAKKMAMGLWQTCTHVPGREVVCDDCVARALDAERDVCIEAIQKGTRVMSGDNAFYPLEIVLAAKAIRALAEEEA